MMKKLVLTLLLQMLFAVSALAADSLSFYGWTDKDPLTYKPGEEMIFSLQVLNNGKPAEGIKFQWTRTGDDGIKETGKAVSLGEKAIEIKTSLKVPGFVYLFAQALDKDGKPYKRNPPPKYCKNVEFYGGAGVLPDQIKGAPEPADFDAFWTKQKARLAKIPMKAKMEKVDGAKGVLCFDVKVDCIGAPVSGYFCKPENAQPKSLPAVVSFHGYGYSGSNKPLAAGRNALAFDVNAHGFLNGQPQSYYDDLAKTTLRGYGFNKKENENPETAYFNGMMLRLIRALEFIKSQPEWNGKDLVVTGGSQGGFQCISAAGLDPDVSLCRASVAWCLDLSGPSKMKRLPGWRPEWTEALGYYDPCNHAKRFKGKMYLSAGLGDYICPPSGQMVLYNNLDCPKELIFNQGCTHGYHMPKCGQSKLSNMK
ncbi:MAG: acetylxylan esterase [Planctomycetia bacterium]|nr:acetylxylan esterase [Planctomycetia bacterium]